MAANISITNGIAEMFYTGATPWHGLGQKLDTHATAEQAIKAAGLDWKVRLEPVRFQDRGVEKISKQANVVVREDNGTDLGVVGPCWTPVQNSDKFSFADAIIGEKAAIYETAGSLGGGKQVWLLAKLKGVMSVKGSATDDIVPYLLMSDCFDGTKALRVRLSLTRVVCQNTLNIAMRESGKIISLRHSKNIGDKVVEVRESLGVINTALAEMNEKINALAAVNANISKVETYFEALGFNPDSKDESEKKQGLELVKAFETSPGAKLGSANGTMWGALNAVTYWVDHAKDWRGTKGSDGSQVKFERTMFGQGDKLKSQAFDLALAMSK